MSVVKKKPEIEKILGRLNATQLNTLRAALNSTAFETPKSLVDPAYKLTVVDATHPTDIGSYRLQLDAQKTRNGFAVRIYNTKLYEHFLVYGESQKITIYELDSANETYRLIEEFCDINELRRVINDIGGEESHPIVATDLTVEGKLELGTSGTIGTTLAGKFSSKRYIHRVQYAYSSVGVYISFVSKEKEEIESMADLSAIIEEEGLLLKENLYGVNCIALNNTDYYQVLTMETGGALIQLQLVSMQMGVAPILLNAGGTFSDYVVAL